MMLKKINPRTSSQRNLIKLNNLNLNKICFIKKKIKGKKKKNGINNSGKIVCKRKGGGHKRRLRILNFNRNESSIGIITTIEYDPGRSGNIVSVYNFVNKNYYYMLAPMNIKIGDIIQSGKNIKAFTGNSLPISKIPVGSLIHNVSTKTNNKSEVSRAAGTFSKIIGKTINTCIIQLSSGEQRYISSKCFATIGVVSNDAWFLTTIGKAGRSRWLNKRPKVRGVAMNPIDHPHGGGEGKTSGGRTSVTPWGKPTKNGKTSKSKNKLRIKNIKKNE